MFDIANGNFGGGTGTENDPYLIEDDYDLDAIRNDLTAHYKQISDIDLNITPYNEGTGWQPIINFRGSFNGDFYTIKNLFINDNRTTTSANNKGIFNIQNGGKVRNVFAIDAFVKGWTYVSIIAGSNYGGLIENCFSSGEIKSDSTSNGWAGGITALVNNGGLVQNCKTIISAKSVNRVGGVVGELRNNSFLKNSYSICTLISLRYTGGISSSASSGSIIENSYTICQIINTNNINNDGGVAGTGDANLIKNCFWDKDASNINKSIGGIGLTTQQAKTAQTYIDAGWHNEILTDGTKIWTLKDGEYPKLWFESPPVINKYLILNENSIYNHDANNWIDLGQFPTDETQQKNLFEEYGLTMVTSEQIKQLKGNILDKNIKVLLSKFYI